MSEKRVLVTGLGGCRWPLYFGEDGVVYWQPQADRVPNKREVAPPETSAACWKAAAWDKLEAIVRNAHDNWSRDHRRESPHRDTYLSAYRYVLSHMDAYREQPAAQRAGVVATASTEDDSELEWDGPYTVSNDACCVYLPLKYTDKQVQLRLYKEQK